jgi:hypothetical protein
MINDNQNIMRKNILKDTNYISEEIHKSLYATNKELLALLISAIKTTK